MLNVGFKPLPQIVFYRPKEGCYKMIDTHKNQVVGEMSVTLREKELFINSLSIKKSERNQGYGRRFLQFAEVISKQYGKQGRLKCMAAVTDTDTHNSPHVFYRKQGFGAYDKKSLQKIDDALKNNKKLGIHDVPIMYMYYPSEM